MRIRPSIEADVAAIAAIYTPHVLDGTASFEIEPPSEAEMRERWRTLVDRDYPYLVAEDETGVVGYAYAAPYRSRAAYRATVENSIYVRADRTRRGIGCALLKTLVDACASRGFRQMVAIVVDADSAPSIRLHESAGFRRVGTLRHVGYKHGMWLDTIIFQRELGERAIFKIGAGGEQADVERLADA